MEEKKHRLLAQIKKEKKERTILCGDEKCFLVLWECERVSRDVARRCCVVFFGA